MKVILDFLVEMFTLTYFAARDRQREPGGNPGTPP